MEKRPASLNTAPTPASASGKGPVKMIKVPVKRPVAPGSAPPPPGKTMVKRIKVPVGKAPAPAPRPAPPPAMAAPRPPAPPAAVPTQTPQPNVIPRAASSAAMDEPKRPLQARRSAAKYKRIVYEVPDDFMDRIDDRETIPEKLFLFYLYARSLAEANAEMDGYNFPEMLIEVPKDVKEAAELIDDVDGDVYEAILDDLIELSPFIPELERVMQNEAPLEKVMQQEVQRVQKMGHPSSGQSIAIAYLMIMADMQAIAYKLEMREIEDEEDETIEEIRSIEDEEKEMKRAFINAIKRKGFPVDADKLIRNYFSLAKKDSEKAYQTLITNPLFFSPIQMEKLPKKFFGLVKPGPKEAIAVNKRLASFLKNLKV